MKKLSYPTAFEVLLGQRLDWKSWCSNPFPPAQLWQGSSQIHRREIDDGSVNCQVLIYATITRQIKYSFCIQVTPTTAYIQQLAFRMTS